VFWVVLDRVAADSIRGMGQSIIGSWFGKC
jgi:hypothetical protein